MKEEFKKKLLKLYPNFDKITGPYLRKDGRKHIVLNNSKASKGSKEKLKTISWPKAKMEAKIGRLLKHNETVDHKDEDLTNNKYSNLQVLTRKKNIQKSHKLGNSSAEGIINYSRTKVSRERIKF